MKTKLLLTLLLINSSFTVLAQNPYHNFLMAAITDVDAMASNSSNSPKMNVVGSWFENAQFRFNSAVPIEDIDLKKKAFSYEIRMQPKAWGQRAIEKEIIQLRLNQQNIAYAQLLNTALQNRYLKLIDYFEQYNELHYLLKNFKLLKQQSILLQSQVNSGQFNPEKLLNTEESLKQNISMTTLYLNRLNTIQTELGIPLDSIDSLQSNAGINWVLSITALQNLTAKEHKEKQLSHNIQNAQLKLQLSQSESKLSTAKQQLGINLLKFEYVDRQSDELSFQVGINIPLGTHFDNTKNQHELHTAQKQLQTSIINTTQALANIRKKIAWLSEDWQLIHNKIKREQAYLQKDYVQNHPFLSINLRKTIIAQQQQQTEIHQKALILYINYLALSGHLSQPPLRNWLHQEPVLLTQNIAY